MAVYTPTSPEEVQDFLKLFNTQNIGQYINHQEIQQGVENSNFFLSTSKGEFVLTIYERRVREDDLPFFLNFTQHLANKGIPAPKLIKLANDNLYGKLRDKPATIVSRLPGTSNDKHAQNPKLCHAAGIQLAQMHLAAQSFPQKRDNNLGIHAWQNLLNRARKLERETQNKNTPQHNFTTRAQAILDAVTREWPQNLPSAIVHADLFPDNVLIQENKIRGVIDFYFACHDALAYDLAICHLAWCHDNKGTLIPERSRELLNGYQSMRELSPEEQKYWHILCAGAGLRFFLTRWIDTILTDDDCNVVVKDPLPMLLAARTLINDK